MIVNLVQSLDNELIVNATDLHHVLFVTKDAEMQERVLNFFKAAPSIILSKVDTEP